MSYTSYVTPDGYWKVGIWQHVAWTLNPLTADKYASSWRIYFDGVLLNTFEGNYPENRSLDWAYIGRSWYRQDGIYHGYMDSFTVFPIALTQNEVVLNMQVT